MKPSKVDALVAAVGQEMTGFLVDNVIGHPRAVEQTLDVVRAECQRRYPGASITVESQEDGTLLNISVDFRSAP
jgi:hypothetical protein